MYSKSLKHRISSDDKGDVLDALGEIQRTRDAPPPEEIMRPLLALLRNPDEEIRYEAVYAACLHWGDKRAVPVLVDMLRGQERDSAVLEIAARSIGSIAKQSGSVDKEALRALAEMVLNHEVDPELRGIAYLSARLALGLLTPQDQAQLPEDINQLDVDWSWIRSIRDQD